MNVFYLDKDPSTCAQQHCDKHVVKMIIEYAQLLSTAHRVLDGEQYIEERYVHGSLPARFHKIKRWKLEDSLESKLYKASHINHPSAVWARDSHLNYLWLASLLNSLCDEYTHRYDKVHKVRESGLSNILFSKVPQNIMIRKTFFEPPPAMPDIYKVPNDSIQSYRNYYLNDKKRFATWKNRKSPEWWQS
jgi:hypothetical protein